ncbi:MAG: SRPBCC family protein [Calditerrivibrio sp.]|nr:SRPBCC family protein [Calditerrivibrio sp.]MCA1932636.1 SRPBCC family protein [Calditerrivibrio sp.]MCA1981005.1 SRPBCC family protein [Calditerrivibrio sp.]
MKLYTLKRVQLLKMDIDRVWEYFSSPYNLEEITPDWLGFNVVTKIDSRMYAGMIIEYRVSPILNIPFKWVTEITHVREPFYFVDEQRFGPYKFWHHQHIFKEVEGGVEMTDIVNYMLPFYPFGEILSGYVGRKLKDIFDFRSSKIQELFHP